MRRIRRKFLPVAEKYSYQEVLKVGLGSVDVTDVPPRLDLMFGPELRQIKKAQSMLRLGMATAVEFEI